MRIEKEMRENLKFATAWMSCIAAKLNARVNAGEITLGEASREFMLINRSTVSDDDLETGRNILRRVGVFEDWEAVPEDDRGICQLVDGGVYVSGAANGEQPRVLMYERLSDLVKDLSGQYSSGNPELWLVPPCPFSDAGSDGII
jgi:hypothetical protein